MPVAGPLLLPTAPLRVMPPAAVKAIAPATARPVLGRLSVCAVTVSPVRFEVKPMLARPATVPAPLARALSVRLSAPDTGPPKLKALPFDVTLTAPPTNARPPVNARPPKPLMALPAPPPVVTSPVNVEPTLPTLPLVNVTLASKVTGPAAVMPDCAATLPLKVVAPEPARVMAAPVPLPSSVAGPTAPVKVVVPLPALTVRLLLPLTLPLKPTLELLVVTVEVPLKTTGLLKVIVPRAAVLVTLPPSVMLPPLVAV